MTSTVPHISFLSPIYYYSSTIISLSSSMLSECFLMTSIDKSAKELYDTLFYTDFHICKALACWTDWESVRLFIFLSIFVVFADSISYENNEILTRNKCIYKTDYCRILLVQQIISSLKQAWKLSDFKDKQIVFQYILDSGKSL